MAVIPVNMGGKPGDQSTYGYTMKNTALDEIGAQGYWNERLQKPQLENQLQREGMQQDTARRGQDVTFANNAMQTKAQQDNAAMGDSTQRRGQDLNFQLGKMPFDWQRERFGQVFPLFQTALNNFGTGGTERVGGANTPTPDVTVGGVLTPEQIAMQKNAAFAHNAGTAATQNRATASNAAARGMSSQSPLVQALMGQQNAARMVSDSDAARQIELDAAGANAKQRTTSEALREQTWQAENQLDINRRQAASQQQNALLAALAGVL